MKTVILNLVVAITCFSACTQTENLTSPGLSGTWHEVEPEAIQQLEGSTFKTLRLNTDYTFEVYCGVWTDVMRHDDPCRGMDDYYAIGTYQIESGSLKLTGCYSDEKFNDCTARCNGETSFNQSYSFELRDGVLTLDGDKHPMLSRVLTQDF